MIQIIRGTYGLYENGMVTPKTSKSKPFTLPEDKEHELVVRGIAAYVSVMPMQPEEQEIQTATELPDYDESMKLDVLREIAWKYGVDASKMRSKKEIISAIDAALAALQDGSAAVDDPLKELAYE